ncbi:MAG TPA: tetratricopeptide repeat protein [Ohtaekwangia sp.]|nr:tetratricopeptide repeat protein [Ohtaekwangia sp.]
MFTRILMTFFTLSSLSALAQNTTYDDLWKLYNSRDFKSVIEKVKPRLEHEPNNIDLNLIIGRTFADQENYDDAVPYLESTVKNDNFNSWRKAWALGYLGTCYFMLQRYEDAERSLNACIHLNATKNATNDAYEKLLLFGYDEFYKRWKTVETENFRFHFQRMDDVEIKKYTSVRERAYREINDFFRSSLPKKIDFYVWDSKDDAKRILRSDLGFSKPHLYLVHTFHEQTIGHEMTHVISHSVNTSVKTRFINEGTAVCFDRSQRDRLKQIKRWIEINNKQISIMDYWKNGHKHDDEILYPLSGLFVEALIHQFGRDKFIEFLMNQTYENARAVFGDELDKLIQEFENKINT